MEFSKDTNYGIQDEHTKSIIYLYNSNKQLEDKNFKKQQYDLQ